MVFGYLPKTDMVSAQLSLLGNHNDWGFSLFMNNHIGAATSFEGIFNFLYKYYFPQASFGPVYFIPHTTFVFIDQLDFVGFLRDKSGLRPLVKHKYRIRHWPTLTSRVEVEDFLWLTSFLHIFIPGRAQHTLIIKQSYLKEVTIELSETDKKNQSAKNG